MYKTFLFVLVATIIMICGQSWAAEKGTTANLLSGNEIDLLVGTPEGISEPLDSRRNTITKDNQVDYSRFLDENAMTDEVSTDLTWEDAEDATLNEQQVENQLMDLLAETEELEKTDEIYYGDEENEVASETNSLKE